MKCCKVSSDELHLHNEMPFYGFYDFIEKDPELELYEGPNKEDFALQQRIYRPLSEITKTRRTLSTELSFSIVRAQLMTTLDCRVAILAWIRSASRENSSSEAPMLNTASHRKIKSFQRKRRGHRETPMMVSGFFRHPRPMTSSAVQRLRVVVGDDICDRIKVTNRSSKSYIGRSAPRAP